MTEPENLDAAPGEDEAHLHDIWTVANIITVVRLMLVPFAFVSLVTNPNNPAAFWLYGTAAATDWVDGQIARRTGTVTIIGKAIDPLVDRLLLASGVIGLYIVERLSLWLVVVLILRDAYMLYGAWKLEKYQLRMPVSYIGKLTTALLLGGFSLLILGWPTLRIEGAEYYLGTVIVYVGVVFSVLSAVDYRSRAKQMVDEIEESKTAAS